MMLWHKAILWAGVVVLGMMHLACDNKKKGELVPGTANPLIHSKAFQDTISEVAWVEGLRRMRVRGYGLVAGLGTRGSKECPPKVRRHLLQEMYKMDRFAKGGRDALPITPEQILGDRDTAVVIVEGEIPAAVPSGTRFDLTVRALPGTQTTSLEGGRLYTCNLRIQRDTSAGSITGQILATAAGPVFINPWSQSPSAATKADPRLGTILGGGTLNKDRRIRLVLEHPSYRRAVAVARCINTRFPAHKKVADGQSPAHIKLHIPSHYAKKPKHFLELVRHLYLPTPPGFLDRRAAELAQEIISPDAPHRDIALAFEGIGRTTLALLQKLYADPHDHASFHAAVAGLQLEDPVAVGPIIAHARDLRSPYRLAAVKALAQAKDMYRTTAALRSLLDDPDPRVRVLAYEGLYTRGDKTVVSTILGKDNFVFDVVHSSAGNLVYAKRTHERRIALFGDGITCLPPLFFCDEEGLITVTADEDARQLTLLRKTPFSNRVSPPISVSLGVEDLVPMLGDDPVVKEGKLVRGLGVSYSLVVKVLADLCRTNAINADFMLEQASVPEIFGPLPKTGRGESDM
ncbi:MAG: flagellar basal body P-ring protein FlgI [Phycisphaerae bacterium]|nr:flagellar basal body P-ring protein FlgI [Phycisphaerae bacterium]